MSELLKNLIGFSKGNKRENVVEISKIYNATPKLNVWLKKD